MLMWLLIICHTYHSLWIDCLLSDLLLSQINSKEKDLECPVCLQILDDDQVQIYRCNEEHLICSICYNNLMKSQSSSRDLKCCQCRVQYRDPPQRFRHMEKTREELKELRIKLNKLQWIYYVSIVLSI